MEIKIAKWGNSASIRLPSAIMAELGVEIDDTLYARMEGGELILSTKVAGLELLTEKVNELSQKVDSLTQQIRDIKP
ncbi:AbrB/MazE/SpoVT family DNA-binding domain-containing protein [Chitinimonas sp. PSY-7]|uniref:AbrB/MazE/SpoVT family DNA-binding domain-containing protein n=1 Tax=Chitinimonas sp. PSY-7 TaxID=3459088 RepID=UPI004040157D